MILDKADQVAADYAPTAFGATVYFQSYIDRLAAQEDGAGMVIACYGLCTATFTSLGAATARFELLGNPSDPTFASGNVVLLDTGLIALATLAVGYQFFRARVPRRASGSAEPTTSFLRYLTVAVIIGTADFVLGSFSAWITQGPVQDNLSYAAGYSFP